MIHSSTRTISSDWCCNLDGSIAADLYCNAELEAFASDTFSSYGSPVDHAAASDHVGDYPVEVDAQAQETSKVFLQAHQSWKMPSQTTPRNM